MMTPSDVTSDPGFANLRVRAGLAVVPTRYGVIVEGGRRRRLLRGEAAASILPKLFQLVAADREKADVQTALGLTARQLDQALRPLLADGILVYASSESAAHSKRGFEESASFFDRNGESYGGRPGDDGHIAGLATARVVLAGRVDLARFAAADLRESGVGHVSVAAGPAAAVRLLDDDKAKQESRRLVVYFEDAVPRDEGTPDELAVLARICAAAGTPLLRCALGASDVEVGPVFISGYTACVECFRCGQQTETAGRELTGATSAGPSEDAVGILAGLAVTEILSSLTGALSGIRRRLLRLAVPDWSSEWFEVVPDRGCRTCWGGQPPHDDAAYSAEVCEWCAEPPPPEASIVAIRARAETERLTALQTQRASFPSSPRQLRPRRTAQSTPTTAVALGAIMNRIAGYRDRADSSGDRTSLRRWAPSGGNIASVEVFAVTRPGVFELPGTVFKYDDIGDQIVAVRADEIPLAAVLAETGLACDASDAVLVLTAATARLASKYESFASRLAHLDAGCAVTQLSLVAGQHGLAVQFADGWGPGLADILEIEAGRQVVTAVAGIRLGCEDMSCH
jgi:SagB-type dehydrogenase family enzyme